MKNKQVKNRQINVRIIMVFSTNC